MFVRLLACVSLSATALGAAPAAAQDKPERTYDPNERVCETITLLGSRLAKKKVCMTRSEWDQRRLQDRQAIDRAQTSPCMPTHTGTNGKPAC